MVDGVRILTTAEAVLDIAKSLLACTMFVESPILAVLPTMTL